MMPPPPPPGFTLDSQANNSSAPPPPPPGFQLDGQQSDSPVQGAMKLLSSRRELMPYGTAPNQQNSPTSIFGQAVDAAKQTLESPIRTGATLSNAPQIVGQGSAIAGGEAGFPKTGAALGTAAEIAPLAYGLFSNVGNMANAVKTAGSGIKSLFVNPESLGNSGISKSTVESMTPPNENPVDFGKKMAGQLKEEGTLSNNPKDALDNAMNVHNQYGVEVKNDLEAIRQAAYDKSHSAMGAYAEYADPTVVDATHVLKPMLDDANQLRSIINEPGTRKLGQTLMRSYARLMEAANANDGKLTFDALENERDILGDAIDNSGNGTAASSAARSAYGYIKKLGDSMIKQVAEGVEDPNLRENLLSHNEGYSRYSRLIDDMRSASAGMATAKQTAPLAGEGKRFLRYVPLVGGAAAATIPFLSKKGGS